MGAEEKIFILSSVMCKAADKAVAAALGPEEQSPILLPSSREGEKEIPSSTTNWAANCNNHDTAVSL